MVLRLWEAADAPAVYEACQDNDIARWTFVPSPYTHQDAESFVGSARDAWAKRERASFAITDAQTGEVVGSCGIKLDGESGEIGYWVKRGTRQRGIATRACRLATEWALTDAGLTTIRLDAAVANQPSQRVAERCGYLREGVVEIDVKGSVLPHVRFRQSRA